MRRRWTRAIALLLAIMTLTGCTAPAAQTAADTEPVQTRQTEPPYSVIADGNPNDVTCKGSYTGEEGQSAAVAEVDGSRLTNGVLNALYWMAVAEYQAAGQGEMPDFDLPLDVQRCSIDDSVNSWQQYFLRQALNNWHACAALTRWGQEEGIAPEEAYNPTLRQHEEYLTDIPAMRYHPSYNAQTFHPNSLHQAYLDGIPQLLEKLAEDGSYEDVEAMAKEAFGASAEDLQTAVEGYNQGYMYFTELTYTLEDSPEETEALPGEDGILADLRHILLIPEDVMEEGIPKWKLDETQPKVLDAVEVAADGTVFCSEAAWDQCRIRAEKLLKDWEKDRKHSEATFADLARKNSADPGSAVNGGAYRNIRQGQLTAELDAWCFAPERKPGDTAILRSRYGCHILYFSGYTSMARLREEETRTAARQADLVAQAREQYPMEVEYEKILLCPAEGAVSTSALLYPDIAHQRYPDVPMYLQQDYVGTMYGYHELRTNGCGITTMAMLASYMMDEALTPPEMCSRYGNYSHANGTDGIIFQREPAVLGFYCREKTYEPRVAKQALADGHLVVSVQHKGYWTRGGHYLLLSKMYDDGTIQVRDSNIFNYGKLKGHKEDKFEWNLITRTGGAFWIFEKKLTRIPACTRCGTENSAYSVLADPEYLCEKCTPALLRRGTYLTTCAQ